MENWQITLKQNVLQSVFKSGFFTLASQLLECIALAMTAAFIDTKQYVASPEEADLELPTHLTHP